MNFLARKKIFLKNTKQKAKLGMKSIILMKIIMPDLINLGLNLNVNYGYTRNATKFGTKVASVGIDSTLKLTPYWSLSGNTNYDFVSQKLAYTRLGFNRDQRSFTFSFNWVPFGQYKVYDFFISIKANILKDAVKYKERSFTPSTRTAF
jgi:lipopolysaccharide assembly outer membrane protein LptD (OstA)